MKIVALSESVGSQSTTEEYFWAIRQPAQKGARVASFDECVDLRDICLDLKTMFASMRSMLMSHVLVMLFLID